METAMLRAYPLVSGGMVLSPNKGEKVHLSRAWGTWQPAISSVSRDPHQGKAWIPMGCDHSVSLCGLQKG